MSSISPVSRGLANAQAAAPSREKEIQSLMQQKSRISEEIQSVRTNDKLDSKLKMERVQSLTASMQEIDAQIAQIRAEEMQEKANRIGSGKPDNKAPSPDRESAPLQAVLKNSITYDHLGKMIGLKDRMEGSIKTVEGEARFDRTLLTSGSSNDPGKSMMLENAEHTTLQKKREQVQDIKSKLRNVDKQIGELVEDIQDIPKEESKPQTVQSSSTAEETGKKDNNHKSAKTAGAAGDENTSLSPSAANKPGASLDIRV
ncbi:FlxA-like family protein [Paenibacillus albidus]|nr:FlxA-like family protein [Paenibacillus albidus]